MKVLQIHHVMCRAILIASMSTSLSLADSPPAQTQWNTGAVNTKYNQGGYTVNCNMEATPTDKKDDLQQHRKIIGYSDLSDEQIKQINSVKHMGELLQAMISRLEAINSTDKRWLAIAKTNLQQGLMAAVRSIANPESF
ncbi:DUF7681 family protein [Candidatus Sororendozoicomonas aggregata]|uniref:Acb2/Tad1 domain-containing protein n=1 Tax=Candidatus Sororendozoicomonas aggregata TaxID=3073239 RepID=UPI002ED4762C